MNKFSETFINSMKKKWAGTSLSVANLMNLFLDFAQEYNQSFIPELQKLQEQIRCLNLQINLKKKPIEQFLKERNLVAKKETPVKKEEKKTPPKKIVPVKKEEKKVAPVKKETPKKAVPAKKNVPVKKEEKKKVVPVKKAAPGKKIISTVKKK